MHNSNSPNNAVQFNNSVVTSTRTNRFQILPILATPMSIILTNILSIQPPADQTKTTQMISLNHLLLSLNLSQPKVDGFTSRPSNNRSSSSISNLRVFQRKLNTKRRCARTGLKLVNATMLKSVSSLTAKMNWSKKSLPTNSSKPNLASNSSSMQLVPMGTDAISFMMFDP